MATIVGNTHTWQNTLHPSGLPNFPTDPPIVLTSSEGENIETTVLAGATTVVFTGLITASKVISFGMHSTLANVNVTTGSQSFALGAALSLGWNTSMSGVANPLTGDVSTITVDNSAGTKDTVFRAAFLVIP
jgi:hypothetical protein